MGELGPSWNLQMSPSSLVKPDWVMAPSFWQSLLGSLPPRQSILVDSTSKLLVHLPLLDLLYSLLLDHLWLPGLPTDWWSGAGWQCGLPTGWLPLPVLDGGHPWLPSRPPLMIPPACLNSNQRASNSPCFSYEIWPGQVFWICALKASSGWVGLCLQQYVLLQWVKNLLVDLMSATSWSPGTSPGVLFSW